jgi:NitT/TauT family transport system ATP-binding protein
MRRAVAQEIMAPAVAVQFDRVSRRFGDRLALSDVSLSVRHGAFVVFVGPSGCGKSTLLGMVAGLDAPSEGYVFVGGRQTAGPTPGTALLFQQYNLFPWMTALDNVAFGLVNTGSSQRAARARARELLERVGLGSFADRIPSELSGGMKQRVALVRAFAQEPRVLLLDEPFAALDFQTRRLMQQYLLTTWRDTRATVLMVTHDLDEALMLGDRIVLLSGSPGRVAEVIDLPPSRVRSRDDPDMRALHQRLAQHLEAEALHSEFSAEEIRAMRAGGGP